MPRKLTCVVVRQARKDRIPIEYHHQQSTNIIRRSIRAALIMITQARLYVGSCSPVHAFSVPHTLNVCATKAYPLPALGDHCPQWSQSTTLEHPLYYSDPLLNPVFNLMLNPTFIPSSTC